MDANEAYRKLMAKQYIERLRQEIAGLVDDNEALEALLVAEHVEQEKEH